RGARVLRSEQGQDGRPPHREAPARPDPREAVRTAHRRILLALSEVRGTTVPEKKPGANRAFFVGGRKPGASRAFLLVGGGARLSGFQGFGWPAVKFPKIWML